MAGIELYSHQPPTIQHLHLLVTNSFFNFNLLPQLILQFNVKQGGQIWIDNLGKCKYLNMEFV